MCDFPVFTLLLNTPHRRFMMTRLIYENVLEMLILTCTLGENSIYISTPNLPCITCLSNARPIEMCRTAFWRPFLSVGVSISTYCHHTRPISFNVVRLLIHKTYS